MKVSCMHFQNPLIAYLSWWFQIRFESKCHLILHSKTKLFLLLWITRLSCVFNFLHGFIHTCETFLKRECWFQFPNEGFQFWGLPAGHIACHGFHRYNACVATNEQLVHHQFSPCQTNVVELVWFWGFWISGERLLSVNYGSSNDMAQSESV